jgi:hypothetical protein
MLANPPLYAKPGVFDTFTSIPREVFYGNRQFAQFWPYPAIVDSTYSRNPLNTPYVWNLWGGMLMGKITTSGKWRPSVVGLLTAAATSGGSTFTTDVNTATEIQRLLTLAGGNISLNLTGPASASTLAASTAVTAVTVTAANLTTGVITVSGTVGANVISGSLIQPADGSQTIKSVQCVKNGLQIVDSVFTTYVDIYCPELLAGGGTLNTGMLVNYPVDPGLRLYVQAALVAATSGVTFYP